METNPNNNNEANNKQQPTPNDTPVNGNKQETTPKAENQDTNKKDGVFRIIGDWSVQSKKLQEKFTSLTESDLKFEPGKEHELLNRMESRLNKKRSDVIDILTKNHSETF